LAVEQGRAADDAAATHWKLPTHVPPEQRE